MVVGEPVRIVVELVCEPELLRFFPGQVVGELDGSIRTHVGGRELEIRTHGFQNLFSLLAHGFGHHQQDAIALDGGHKRQSDARVAARRLQDDLVLGQLPGSFRFFDHVKGRPVFHGSTGVEGFEFGQDLNASVGIQLADGHERRPADVIKNVIVLLLQQENLSGKDGINQIEQ